MSHGELVDYEFTLKLRYEGVITTPGDPFEQSDQIEIESLLANSVLLPLQYDSNKHAGVFLFKSRLVYEIKGKMINKSYKKSCLVVQSYNDIEKTALLTQALTIQQCSQCLLISVAPVLRKQKMKIMLWNIMQAYTQSKKGLNCTIICYLPAELKKRYPKGTILLVVKPLYGLAKAGNHWFAIYLDHHKEKLGMEMSLYDACLLITKDGGENFSIAGLQTNDTLNIGTEAFMKKEEKEILKAKFKAKIQTILETGVSGDFNSCQKTIKAESIIVVQNNQAEKLVLVDIKDKAKKQYYMEQYARGAYIASIC